MLSLLMKLAKSLVKNKPLLLSLSGKTGVSKLGYLI